MDPTYNVLWVFDGVGRKLRCHNVVASDINANDGVSRGRVPSANPTNLTNPIP